MTNYPANEHQPPLGLPRRITHPNLPEGKEQVTLPMNISPLSVSPVGEMQATPLRQRLGDAGYSASAEIERCRNRCSATDSHDRKGKPKVTKQQ